MPGIVVSLSEALAVSGTPLAESYVWAILNQCAVYFNKITKGRKQDFIQLCITNKNDIKMIDSAHGQHAYCKYKKNNKNVDCVF